MPLSDSLGFAISCLIASPLMRLGDASLEVLSCVCLDPVELRPSRDLVQVAGLR